MKTSLQLNDPVTARLIQQLKKHQIEMEMQNEELIIARAQAFETAQRYTELYDFAPTGYFTLSREGKIIELNICGSQMLGKERKQLINARFGLFVSEDTKPIFNLLLEKTFHGRTRQSCEIGLSIDDLPLTHVRLTAVFSENGDNYLLSAIDISDLKISKDALAESENNVRNFIRFSSDPIFGFNRDGTYHYVNEAFARPFGKNPDEIIGKTPFDIFTEDEAEKRIALVRKVFQTGEKGEIEVQVTNHSGHLLYYLTTVDPLKNGQGEVIYVNCVSKDITLLKEAEQALKASEAQIAALLAAIPDMIFIQDQKGVYLDYHGPISNELYTQPDNFIGKNMFEVIPLGIAQQFELAFQAAKQAGEVQLCEYSMQIHDRLNHFEAKIAPYSDSKFLSAIRNVSAHKQAEELIKVKNADLQRINAEKDKFFSIIAHDLRSPFSGFLGLTETLARRLPDMTLTEIQEITFLMRNSAVQLFRLLGNLLEWSRMQRGLMAYLPKSFLVSQKIGEYLFLADQLAHQKEITINRKIPESLIVLADENMFGSIIRNLLSNAVKFTPKGGRISISAAKHSAQLVKISVKDSGIGMNQQLIDHLFRLDDIQSNRKGTDGEYSYGLGLIICKDYIEKHGGKLEIKSSQGDGSTFSFTLPAGSLSFTNP